MAVSKGERDSLNLFLRIIGEDKRQEINNYLDGIMDDEFEEFSSLEEAAEHFSLENLSYDEASSIIEYSGYDSIHINAALRNKWTYEQNGLGDLELGYREKGYKLADIIENHQTYGASFKAFRGVTLSYFKDYGVRELEDLVHLEGKFILDEGFVSTSLFDRDCYFKKSNDIGNYFNVKIEYMIPEDFGDGIYTGDNPNLSYTPNQHEYVINTYNLARVGNVTVDKNDGTAVVRAYMCPKHIYDDVYRDRLAVSQEKSMN